jgi:multidrug transporter EmrE-like cation transporter
MTFYAPQEGALFTLIACVGAVLVGTTWLLVLLLRSGEKLLFRSVVGGLVLGVPNVLSFYFLLKALGAFGNSAAFVFPIYNILSMLASAAAAWLLFRERLSPLNRLGLALAVLAIVLISYQELGM